MTCYTHGCISPGARTPRATRRQKEPVIYQDARTQQGDLVVGLLSLLGRNRLALVVLAASLTTGARRKARGVYADSSSAVRWLARNARSVSHFLLSLARLRRCAGQAGYLALERARPPRRLETAPRRLRITHLFPIPDLAPGSHGPGRLLLRTAPARL